MRLPIFVPLSAVLLGSVPHLSAQTVSIWTGGTGDWLDPTRWSPSGVPNAAAADVVVDNAPGTTSVVTLGRNDNVGTFLTVGRLSISTGDTVRFGSAVNGLAFDSSSFSGAGSLVLNGTLNLPFSSGGLSGSKTITGTGTLLLGSEGQRPEITGFTSNAATIKGSALFGRANASNPQMINSGLIEANISGQDIDFHGQGGVNRSVNSGTLKATNGGKLQLGQGEWLNTGGNVIADGAVGGSGSQVAFYRGGLLEGGTVSSVNGGRLQVGGSFNGSNGGHTFKNVTLTGPMHLADTLQVAGTLTDNGTIHIPGGGRLYHASGAGVTIAGTGEIVLDAPEDDAPELIDQGDISVASVPWTFSGVKVRGRGNVGYRQSMGAVDNVAIINQGTFQADVDGQTLLIDVSNLDNQSGGLLRATGSGTAPLGGILRLAVNGTVKNTGGTIEALNKGRVEAALARIEGGLVRNTGGFINLNGTTLVNPGTGMRLEGEHQLGLAGAHQEAFIIGEIENTGILRVASSTHFARLRLGSSPTRTASLTGGGQLILGDPASTSMESGLMEFSNNSQAYTLTNVDNTIRGFGRIGDPTYDRWLILNNTGAVAADVADKTLQIELHSANNSDGIFRASGGGRMNLFARQGFNNTGGEVEALANSTAAFYSTEITGGIISTAATGTIEFPDSNTARGGVVITNAGTTIFGAGGGTREFSGTANGGSTFINAGTMRKTGSGDYSVRTALNSTGSIVMESGILRIFGGGTVSANTFTIPTGTDLTFQGAAPFTFSGVTTSSGGGMLHIDDQVYLADADAELRTSNFRFYNGKLSGPGILSHSGRLEFYQGTNNAVSGSRLLTKPGATASIEAYYYAPVQFSDGATWENHGTIVFADAGWRPVITGTTGTAIINCADGVIRNDDGESGALEIPTQNQGRFEVTRGRLFIDKPTAWSGGTASISAGAELQVRSTSMTMDGTANSSTGEGWLHVVGTGSLSLPTGSRLAADRAGFWETSGISGPGEIRVSKAAEWRPSSNGTHVIDGTQVNLLADSVNLFDAFATFRLQNGALLHNSGTFNLRSAFNLQLDSGGVLENSGTITATSSGNNPSFGGDDTGLFRTTTDSVTRFFPSNGNTYAVGLPFDFAGQFYADSGMNVTFDRGGLLNETAKLSPNHPSSSITLTGATKIYRVRGQANEFPGTGYVNLNNTTLQFEPSSIAGNVSSIAAGARVAFHGNNTVKGNGTLATTGFVFQNGDQTVDGSVLETFGTADVSVWNASGKRVQFLNGAKFKNGGRFVIQSTMGSAGNPGFYGDGGTQFHNTSTGRLVHDTAGATVFGLPFHNEGILEFRAGSISFAGGYTGTGGLAVVNGVNLNLNLQNTPANQLPSSLEVRGAGSRIDVTPPLGGLTISSMIGNDGSTLVAAGGLNLINGANASFSGAGTVMNIAGMIGNDGSTLIGNDGSTLVAAGGLNMINGASASLQGSTMNVTGLIGNDGSTLIGNDGSTLVAAGGMNLTHNAKAEAIGAGTKFEFTGLIGNDGSTVIARDGASFKTTNRLIGNDGSTLIGNDGSTISGSSLIGNDGSTLIGNDGSTLIGNDGSTISGISLIAKDVAALPVVPGGLVPRNHGAPGDPGTIVVNTGSLIAGNGTFRGHGYVLTGSSLLPGKQIPGEANGIGTLQWDGPLEIDAGCTLGIQIGGKTAGTEHDVLNVTGALSMNGTLAVSLVNGFGSGLVPTDVFDIAVAAGGVTSTLAGTRVSAAGSFGSFLVSVVNGGTTLRLSDFQALPVTYAAWVGRYGLTGTDANPGTRLLGSDLSNLMKYALGLDPTQPGGRGPTVGIVQDGLGNRYLSLSYTKPTGAELPTDLIYAVERASALSPADWSSSSEHVAPEGAPVAGPGNLQTITVRSTHPIGSGGAREFLRLRVTLPP